MSRCAGVYVTRRGGYEARTQVVSVKLPVSVLAEIDELINRGYFQSRSDAIREAIRRMLSSYQNYNSNMLDQRAFVGFR